MRRTRVKICGITRLEDAYLAQRLGVDSLGFVFVPASARYVTPAAAAEIVVRLSPFVTPVGLFLDPEVAQVRQALELMPALVPQFHGRESGEFCDQFGRAYLKAIGVGQAGVPPDIEQLASYTRAVGFLFDSHEPGQPGGTGHAFDWTQIGESRYKPMVLAGGLNVHNVEQAIEQVRPYAVDVSSGVEIDKGLKDGQAMRDFMDAVGRADARLQTRQTEQLTG